MSSHTPNHRLNQVLGQLQPNESSKLSSMDASSADAQAAGYKQDDLIYTFDNGIFTRQEREFYEKNGYFVTRGIVSQKEMDVWKQRFLDICENKVERVPTMTVMKDISQVKLDKKGENVITKVQDFQDDPVLFTYCAHPNVVKYVSCFCGPNVKSIHSMLIHKPPNVGESGRHPFHQDLYYFPYRPANRIVCAWTAMEKITRENGGLSVIPGTHKGKLFAHDYPKWGGKVNKAYHGIIDLEPPEDRVHLEMEPGDTVFFHPLLIHGSGANKTQGYRKAISCHYASIDCETIDVKGTIQESIGEEIVGMAAKFGVPDLTFQDIWRLKSRRVLGIGELQ